MNKFIHFKVMDWIKGVYLLLFLLSACTNNANSVKHVPGAKDTPALDRKTRQQQQYNREGDESVARRCAPLLEAIEKNDLENVNTLLEHYRHDLRAVQGEALSTGKGADINARDAHGNTPLLHAVSLNKVEALKLLLNTVGIDVNIQCVSDGGGTALHVAVRRNFKECYNLLLDAEGVNVNVQDQEGETPLHIAVARRYPDVAFIKALLTKGADVNITANSGNTSLQGALYNFQENAFSPGRFIDRATMLELVSAAASSDVNTKNRAGQTALHTLLERGIMNPDILNSFIQSGADVNVQDNDGKTPLHILFRPHQLSWPNGCQAICEIFLASGANVALRDKAGCTVLDYVRDLGEDPLMRKNNQLQDTIKMLGSHEGKINA